MRTKMQSGEIGVALSWNSYIRGILSSDWNTRDQVAVPVYPASGSPGDRETLRVAKGTKHPVAARVLINWMISPDFINAGWTQDPATGTETNKWNLSKQDYLQTYFGGINAEGRKLAPKWAAPFYPPDPAAVTMIDGLLVRRQEQRAHLERVQGPAVSQDEDRTLGGRR